MPPQGFGEKDVSQVKNIQRIIDESAQRFIANLKLKTVVDRDLEDKNYATQVINNYVTALQPAKTKKYNYRTDQFDEVNIFPSEQEILNAATEAQGRLSRSEGRHSTRIAKQINEDVVNRSRFKKADPRKAELDWYIETYGMEDGLRRYNETISTRPIPAIGARTEGAMGVQDLKNKGALELQTLKQKHAMEMQNEKNRAVRTWFAVGEPKTSAAGTIILNMMNGMTGVTKTVDTGVKELPKATAGAGGAKIQESLSNVGAFQAQLEEYEKLLVAVDDGRLGGNWERLKALVGHSDYARAAGGQQDALASFGARVINGERGMLTNQDIDRAKKLIPLIQDTESERALKFTLLKKLLEKRKQALGQGYDGAIHVQELSDQKFAPEYGDINWDVDDSKTYFQEYKHWPSYEEAQNEMLSLEQ